MKLINHINRTAIDIIEVLSERINLSNYYFRKSKSRLIFFILFFYLIVNHNNSTGQYVQEWVRTYTESILTIPEPITYSKDFIYIAGSIKFNLIGGDCGIVVLKFDKSGNLIWDYTSTIGFGMPRKMVTDNYGNIFITGGFTNRELYKEDYVTIKLDSAGNLLWMKRYFPDSSSRNISYSMCIDDLSNIYVTGMSKKEESSSDIVTIKYDSSGNQIWEKRFTSTPYQMDDVGKDIAVDKNGDVFIAGEGSGFGAGSDAVLLKYDSTGVLKWHRRYDFNNGGDYFSKITIDDSSRIRLIGISNGYGLMMIYSVNGDLLKTTRFKPTNINNLFLNFCDSDKWNNLYVSGYCDNNNNNQDICVLKYNSEGDILWYRIYDGGHNLSDFSSGIKADKFGNCYTLGRCKISEPNYDVMTTIAYDKNGNKKWEASYSGEIKVCQAQGIAIDTANGVYVTGASQNNITQTGLNIVLVKYSSLVNIGPTISTVPEKFELHQNFPNPFNPTTNIKFDLPDKSFVRIKIYDILGKEITNFVNKQLNPGTYQIEWNASDYPSGVYFYRMEAGNYIETRKLILLK